MDILSKGTKIRINLKSDWLDFEYTVLGTREKIRVTYKNDIKKIANGRLVQLTRGIINRPPIITTLEDDIPILENYSNSDIRIFYKDNGVNRVSDRIVDVNYFTKNGFIINTEDNITYYIDILIDKEDKL